MKIGVAIPCYYGHINNLFSLLDSIEKQTILPDKVVVSCSSTQKLDLAKNFKIPLEIIVIEEKMNAAQNRNIAASKLMDMDYITFMDADDVMHPQRIEILLDTIKKYDSDIILHNYYYLNSVNIFEKIKDFKVRINTLIRNRNHIGITQTSNYDATIDKIHHSQVTIKSDIFNIVKFPEEIIYNRMEDSIFCNRVFNLPNIKHAYIQNELSLYNPSNTVF